MQFVKLYFMIFVAMKFLGEMAASNVTTQFLHAELGRIRFSLTSGNIVQLLMRIEEKCNYMELLTKKIHRPDQEVRLVRLFWLLGAEVHGVHGPLR